MRKRPLFLAALLAIATTSLFADKLPFPGRGWNGLGPASSGWDPAGLSEVQGRLRHLRPTALVILQNGRPVADWGEVGRKVTVYSVRKSILSALVGIAVGEGRIDLDRTLGDLGIDDTAPSLTPEEKAATVRDLIRSRSGIYHPAAFEVGRLGRDRPPRGSHPPGSVWYYNNFDFNALGTVYRRTTGEDIFEAVERRIARPLGMEDFTAADGTYVHEPQSEHPAYLLRMTARDLSRFGQLYLDGGRWGARQVVPAGWVAESTRRHSDAADGLGYGYLWWQLPPGMEGAEGAFYAMGYGGQAVAVVPSRRLVVVQTLDVSPDEAGLTTAQFIDLLRLIIAAAPRTAS